MLNKSIVISVKTVFNVEEIRHNSMSSNERIPIDLFDILFLLQLHQH